MPGGVLFLMQSIPFIRSKMAVREMASFELGSIIKGLTIAPYNTVLWTILQLIIFVALAPIIFWSIKNKYVGLFTLIAAFAVSLTDWNIPMLIHGNVHLFTYVLGAYIGLHCSQKIYEFDIQRIHYIFALLIVVMLCALYEFGIYNILCQITAFVALYIVAYFIAHYTRNCSVTCYGLSFWIYAMHNWLQPCIMKLWLLTGIKGNIGALAGLFGCAFLTITLCMFCAKTCKKWMPRIYLILSGGRG